jgi:hypothetical protein
MRPGHRWSVASTSKKPPGGEGGQLSSCISLRFGYFAGCPRPHQSLPTGSEISTRVIRLESRIEGRMLQSFIATHAGEPRCHDSTALLCTLSTILVRCDDSDSRRWGSRASTPVARSLVAVEEGVIVGEGQVPVLFRTDMAFRIHRLPTHRANGPTGRGEDRRIPNQRARLAAR